MKRLLFAFTALAMLVTSCAKDATTMPVVEGETVVSFKVSSPKMQTRYGEGTTANKLLFAVYQNDNLMPNISALTLDEAVDINLTADVKIPLVKGLTYNILFWAQNEEAPYTFDGKKVTIDYANLAANEEAYDAFFRNFEVHIENSIAAVAMLWCAAKIEGKSFDYDKLRKALREFEGVKRRMEVYVNTPDQVYIDDYAHHPEELRATITSLRGIFPNRRLVAVFQPHLYTRTRDFAKEFAEVLSEADKVVMVPIYPARELPIEGVTSELIGRDITAEWELVERDNVAEYLKRENTDVTVTFGAGNIDVVCADVAKVITAKLK